MTEQYLLPAPENPLIKINRFVTRLNETEINRAYRQLYISDQDRTETSELSGYELVFVHSFRRQQSHRYHASYLHPQSVLTIKDEYKKKVLTLLREEDLVQMYDEVSEKEKLEVQELIDRDADLPDLFVGCHFLPATEKYQSLGLVISIVMAKNCTPKQTYTGIKRLFTSA